jgi:UDP-N-acetylmuramoyl-L-alanyl-D-glutamate--2,6-diaminopimelate ligase
MRLSVLAELLPDGGQVVGEDADVSDVTHDSRAVEAGDLFVAVRGAEADGHRFVDAALEAGASAVAVDHVLPGPPSQLLVDDTRAALGTLASAVHGNPSQHLAVVGITGTNGKTTVAHLIESIVAASGQVPGVIGTVGARIEGEHVPVPRTTPEGSMRRLMSPPSRCRATRSASTGSKAPGFASSPSPT